MTYRFLGGPLDGQTVDVRGRSSCYRDASGCPVPAQRGDRVLCSGYARRPPVSGLYARVTHSATYVWQWRKEP